ncbi:MAG: nucleoside triphosphate pyrophosphohydrolase family protein [Christensenellaceae bacterium]|jgi:NTP pyrophosphatase (non-canonical NTP hydrolase)|nr:nucleoside triphosphate pyrophosphohydrolase family protein [Christensenellaceae bacterium]
MTFEEYKECAMQTRKEYGDPEKEIVYYALGLAGETGEVVEHIKKHYRDGREIDKEAIKKELGDVLWYIAGFSHVLGFDMSEIAEANVKKLKARHGDSYSGFGNREGEGK